MKTTSGLFTPDGAPVPLLGVKARACVTGRLARATVAWRFRNAEGGPIEAVCKFPLPESAAVCAFRARVGDRVVTGETAEREAAFAAYDDALAAGDGAFLLDEERPNLFTLSLGNLEPGAEALVELSYVETLEFSGGRTRFVFPATITPRYLPANAPDEDGRPAAAAVTPPYAEKVPYGLEIEIDLFDRANVEAVESPSHPVRTTFRDDRVRVEFAHGRAEMNRDFVLSIDRSERAQAVSARAAACPGGGSVVALEIAPPETDAPAAPRELVFLLDCSGSMAGSSIASAREALGLFLRGLEPGATFNVIRFGSSFESFFPAPREYSEASLAEALARLDRTDADLGGTEALAPLQAALARPAAQGRPRAILFITDGAVGNEEAILDLARAHAGSTRIFPVGIGHGPNDFFLRALARATGGASERIAPGERIEPRILRLFRRATTDPATAPRIDWRGHPADRTPAPDAVWPGEARTLFARFDGEAPASVYVEMGVPGAGTLGFEVPVGTDPEGSALPALYAREAIRAIEEGKGAQGSAQGDRRAKADGARLVELSTRFNVLSRATSFVAVERREEGGKTTEAATLRRVPCAVTDGYGGMRAGAHLSMPLIGSTVPRGGAFAAAMPCMAPPPPAPKQAAPAKGKARRMRAEVDAECDSVALCAAPREAVPCEPASAPPKDATNLYALLAMQKASGGFDLPEETLEALGLAPSDLASALAAFAPAAAGARLLLVTAFLLAHLAARHADEREAWEPVTRKSARMVARSSSTVAGVPLQAWAAARAKG